MYVCDMHTHTIASGHAYNTINEMAQAASEKGIKFLGITEHAVTMPGTCHEIYFRNLRSLSRTIGDVTLAFGVELNIISYDGDVDMNSSLLSEMDIAIASIHPTIGYEPGDITQNTNAIIGAIKNPYVNIIGHPDDGRVPMDYEAIVKAAKEHHTLLEINNNSLTPGGWRKDPYGNDETILKLCMEHNTPVIIGSDAHSIDKVGCHDYAMKLINEVGFPRRLIANYDMELVKSYTNRFADK